MTLEEVEKLVGLLVQLAISDGEHLGRWGSYMKPEDANQLRQLCIKTRTQQIISEYETYMDESR